MKYTQAQKSEEQFISELKKFLDKPEINKVLALVHQHYFNPVLLKSGVLKILVT